MLTTILKRIARGGPVSLRELAKESSTSEEMILQQLSDLLRMGYLEHRKVIDEPTCSSGCGGCSGCTVSEATQGLRLHVTAKGLEKVARDAL